MSLDLHVHGEVDVCIFLPRRHRSVLHRVQIYTVHIYRTNTDSETGWVTVLVVQCNLDNNSSSEEQRWIFTFDTDGHVRIDALPSIL